MTKHYFTYLALGDSYTIGESVPLDESFPYQTVQLLRKNGVHIHAAEIVARTGWTTLELAEHILHARLNDDYDFVTLLIGVNNQYRGLNIDDYKNDFEFLLKKALHFADDKNDHVMVLSIPDWSQTPFAREMDKNKISEEITAFNKVNHAISTKYKVHYIQITDTENPADTSLIAHDALHPSGKEYARWAQQIASVIQETLSE